MTLIPPDTMEDRVRYLEYKCNSLDKKLDRYIEEITKDVEYLECTILLRYNE